MDDMAKVKVGAPAVSRYHQLRRIFGTNDSPNYSDHDFPVPNYLLAVSGYMVLESSSNSSTVEQEGLQLASAYDCVTTEQCSPQQKQPEQNENDLVIPVLEKLSVKTKSYNDFFKIFSSQLSTHLKGKFTPKLFF